MPPKPDRAIGLGVFAAYGFEAAHRVFFVAHVLRAHFDNIVAY
jgi:hypothetical protein